MTREEKVKIVSEYLQNLGFSEFFTNFSMFSDEMLAYYVQIVKGGKNERDTEEDRRVLHETGS